MILPVSSRSIFILSLVIGAWPSFLPAEEWNLRIPPAERMSIRSDEAWEDPEPGIIHFNGRFRLEAVDWSVAADSATLYGNLDDPETVTLAGTPARFRILVETAGVRKWVQGNAARIVLERHREVLRMENDARLEWGENVIRGAEIVYDLENDTFSAGGSEGVRILVPPSG